MAGAIALIKGTFEIMPQHEKKQCPRCSSEFECKTGSILLCQCSKIEMSPEQLEYTSTKYDECLCLDCLKELRSEYNHLSNHKNIKNILLGRS